MLDVELDLASSLARAAAAAILAVKSTARAHSSDKADHSPVTAADLAADRVIRAGLDRFKIDSGNDDVIVTEETFTTGPLPARGRVWIVDPLDGTRDFVAGSVDYVVQIALVVDGVPRLGVVCQPETGRLWRAIVGERCEHVDANNVVTTYGAGRSAAGAAPRFAVSVSHPSAFIDNLGDAMKAVMIPRGSVGLKIGAILDDEADGYVTDSRHIKVWDTAAPAAILLAAGGTITSLSGAPLRYDRDVAHDDGVAAFGSMGEHWRLALQTTLSTLR